MADTTSGALAPLSFHSTRFDIVDRFGQPWLRSPQIAEALGYAQANRITDLYNRNAAEFTDSMTALVKLPDLNPQSAEASQMRETRIFSLRGAHLLGMFAQTAVAKEFRHWVLDVLDDISKTGAYIHAPAMRPALTLEQQAEIAQRIRHLSSGWAISEGAAPWVYNHLRVAFYVGRWQDIPTECFPAVIAMLEGKDASLRQYLAFLREAREFFERECLGGGTPWTPAIQRKMSAELGRRVILPPKVDWLALADSTKAAATKGKGKAKPKD